MTIFTVANLADLAQQHVPVGSPAGNVYGTVGPGTYVLDGSAAQTTVTLNNVGMLIGQRLTLKRSDIGILTMKVVGAGGALVDGIAQFFLDGPQAFASFEWDGTGWWRVG